MTIDKTYDPSAIEQSWYNTWEKNGYFRPSGKGEPYCIMLPPPNVTGSLHMGHGFGFTLMDILVRYHRMRGFNTLWQPGTDHAGIATQMVVERRLNREGKTRHTLGREAFVDEIWAWKKESGHNITQQLRRLGASLDWERECFTMDEGVSNAVREVFIRLFNEKLIYRGKRLVNWDPVLQTAISDLEVVNEEEDGFLWHIRYPLAGSDEYLVVATTRPETMFGDTAVAVHPEDKRYQHLIGKEVMLPLANRKIPIIADDYVDAEFGTGCVKITPAHDFNDAEIGKRHHLQPINILTPTAHLNTNVPEAYQGLERFAARKQVVVDLTQADLIVKIDKHKLKVPRGDRSQSAIEPYLTYQWYIKSKPLSEPAIKAVQNNDIRFIPENWDKTYYQWMDNIEDWCISRQLWWGHRIPVWYDDAGNYYVGKDEADVRQQHQLGTEIKLQQDEDVLDTWFSSALWPFTTLGWPDQTPELKTFFPTTVLVTGFDIIFFWVARMIMMSLKFTSQIPFADIYITGLIRDAEGHKMSKSKGNVLDPIDLIDGIDIEDLIQKRTYGLMQPNMEAKITKATRKEFPEGISSHGTDALRFTFCSLAAYTREIRFDIQRLAGYRNFCNKLWNASRYVFMTIENSNEAPHELSAKNISLSAADQWIVAKLQMVIEQCHAHLKKYRFDMLAQTLYDFTWNEFCDWYVEFSKPLLTDDNPAQRRGTLHTLIHVLENLLRLLHPIMPFITEEIWQRIAPFANKTGKTIMLEAYPECDSTLMNQDIMLEIEWVKKIVTSIRTIRSEMNISPAKRLSVLLHKGTKEDQIFFKNHQQLLMTLAKLESIQWLDAGAMAPPSATGFVNDLEILIPLAGFIDKDEEIARLNKEKNKCVDEKKRIEAKLENPSFVDRAPAAVVEKEREKLHALRKMIEKIDHQITVMVTL